MDITSLIIQLVIGAIGGNAAGKVMPDKSLGTLGNTIAGVVGGGLGGQLLSAVMGGGAADAAAAAATSGLDIGSLIQSCRWRRHWRRGHHGSRRHAKERDEQRLISQDQHIIIER